MDGSGDALAALGPQMCHLFTGGSWASGKMGTVDRENIGIVTYVYMYVCIYICIHIIDILYRYVYIYI